MIRSITSTMTQKDNTSSRPRQSQFKVTTAPVQGHERTSPRSRQNQSKVTTAPVQGHDRTSPRSRQNQSKVTTEPVCRHGVGPRCRLPRRRNQCTRAPPCSPSTSQSVQEGVVVVVKVIVVMVVVPGCWCFKRKDIGTSLTHARCPCSNV